VVRGGSGRGGWVAAAGWLAACLAVATCAPSRAAAEGLAEILARGNAAYRAGNFAAAAREYETIRSTGGATPDLHFNLGNAYAKSGEIGKAVASYERSRLHAPRDRELLENLAMVREQCVDQEPSGAGLAARAVSSAVSNLTADEWTAIFLTGYLGLLGSIVGPYFWPGTGALWGRLLRVAVALSIAGGVGIGIWHATNGPGRRGVVEAPEVTVRSGPDTSYLGEFSLHPGSLVRIEGRREGWLKVRFSPSLRGWTEATGVEIL